MIFSMFVNLLKICDVFINELLKHYFKLKMYYYAHISSYFTKWWMRTYLRCIRFIYSLWFMIQWCVLTHYLEMFFRYYFY